MDHIRVAFWVGFFLGTITGLVLGVVFPVQAEPMPANAPRPSWGDLDGDCQDTRQEILIRDAFGPVRLSPDGCRVVEGLWGDPYGGGWITDPREIEIDHIVAQSQARKAREWTREEFVAFYRDPLNLVAVSRVENQYKRSKTVADYLPPNPRARCWFVRRVDAVRRKYGLTFGPLDMQVLSEWRERCRP